MLLFDEASRSDVVPREWPGLRYQMHTAGPPGTYACVLIMAGTNDLADRVPTETIVDNLAALHAVAHAYGARTIAMTIPESHAALKVGWLSRARSDANAALKAWALQTPVTPQFRSHNFALSLVI